MRRDYQFSRGAAMQAGIDWEEAGRCAVIKRTGRAECWIPAFAISNESLRLVVAVRAWHFLHSHKPHPPDVVAHWKELDAECWKRAAARYEANPTQENKNDLASTLFARSYMGGQMSIAYRCWRLRQKASDVAAELGLTNGLVQMMLARLIATAEKLGLPIYPQRGFRKGKGKPPKPRKTHDELSAIRKACALAQWQKVNADERRNRTERARAARKSGMPEITA